MPTFDVNVRREIVQTGGIQVDAATLEEAKELARDRVDEITYWEMDAVLDTAVDDAECVSEDCPA